jgi:myo-inositol-1-phosphate synthase
LGRVKVAVIGVGNCCSSLVQGTHYYSKPGSKEEIGLAHPDLGGYKISDIEFVAAFDVDQRKVGRDISEAIFAEPNNTVKFCDVPKLGVTVQRGELLDGVGEYVKDVIKVDPSKSVDVAQVLKENNAEILVNLLPAGALKASKWYAERALEAGCGFINATPARIASVKAWQVKFSKSRLPVAGDDVMDQIGSTILHKTIFKMLVDRAVTIDESYQLDIGGGTESLNALERDRGEIKRRIKKLSVSSVVPYMFPLVAGSSDYVDFMENTRTSYFWIKGRYFGGAPFTMDVKLNLIEGPAAGGVLLDAIRAMKIALDRGIYGPLISISAYAFKFPPKFAPPHLAQLWLKEFIAGKRNR